MTLINGNMSPPPWHALTEWDDSSDEEVAQLNSKPQTHCSTCQTPTTTPIPFAVVDRINTPSRDTLCSPRCLKLYQIKETPKATYTDYSIHNYSQQHWQAKISIDLGKIYGR